MLDLFNHLDEIHTTPMGKIRILKNLNLQIDGVELCKKDILNPLARILRQGKNWYVYIENRVWTINAYSYTIITAHLIK